MVSDSLNSNKDQWSDLSIILEFVNINSESIQVWVGLVWVECFFNFDNTHSHWTINLKFLTTSHDDFLHIKSILELYPDEETNRVDNISE
jgi:hypothetical protein